MVAFGERHDLPWLMYNPVVFRRFHVVASNNAPGLMAALGKLFPRARSYVDVGAGSGAYAAEAQRRGRDVVACEHSPFGRLFARAQRVRCEPLDLNDEPAAQLDRRFDLAYCLEVAEHLPPQLGDRLVHFISNQAPVVVFSASRPGLGGIGHINEQEPEYWIPRFESNGMRHRADLTRELAEALEQEGVAPWLIGNMLVFEAQAP